MAALNLLSVENEVFKSYLFYCSILILKMMFMSVFTGTKRMKYKAFANPEDAIKLNIKPKADENVERVRRAHLNDLENIPLFFVGAFVYILTNPTPSTAKTLFLVYTIARVLHSMVYAVVPIPQPARAITFFVGYTITGYMAINSCLHFLS